MKMARSLVAAALLVGWAVWPGVAGQTAADATSDLANRYAESDTGFDNRTAPLDYLDLDGLVNDWLWTGRPGGCDADLSFDGIVDFLDFTIFASRWSDRERSVAIIVDSGTYAGAASEIDRLAADITNDLDVDVFICPNEWRDAYRLVLSGLKR